MPPQTAIGLLQNTKNVPKKWLDLMPRSSKEIVNNERQLNTIKNKSTELF